MAKKTTTSKAPAAGITTPRGFQAAGITCGIKPSGNPDLTLIVADVLCAAAGVFTRNAIKGAPVLVSQKHIRSGIARAIVTNSGCSNVATGEQGIRNAQAMCAAVAKLVDCQVGDVLVCSTGVIGKHLPMDKILPGIDKAFSELASGSDANARATRAIMTTDLVPKRSYKKLTLDGKTVHLAGICKGSGMIAPNMATMLAFITTDAAVSSKVLSAALKTAVNATFNRCTVDSDTSTSDSVMVLASGMAGNKPITTATGDDYDTLLAALIELCRDMCYQLVKDGEGATKVFRVVVRGAKSERDADKVGKSIAESPLVKTAVHGGDPNWGRLAMGVGKSGAKVKPETLSLSISGIKVLTNGTPETITPAIAKKLDKAMAAKDITFDVDLGIGNGACEWLSCDLSREYITINADYTT